MILNFKFKYISSNKTLAKFLDFQAKKFDCEYKTFQDLDFVYLFIQAEDEVLENFANSLSTFLPMSIFYYGLDVQVAQSFPKKSSLDLKEKSFTPFCPSCMKKVQKNYDIFTSCSLCGGFEKGKIFLDKEEVQSNKILFEKLAKLISEDKKIKIHTLSGEFVFSKVKDMEKSSSLLVTNIKNISSLVVEDKTSIVALVSLEKPMVDFVFNEVYKIKENISKTKISLRMPNDLFLYCLAYELEKYDIDFLDISFCDDFDYEVSFEKKSVKKLEIPKIKCFEDKKLFLSSSSYPKNLDEVYAKFDEPNKAHFMTVIAENNLFDKSILNFYISSRYDDGISFYSSKIDGLVDVLDKLYIPKSIEEIFTCICKDEIGKKLLENYKIKFPKEYESALQNDISHLKVSSFYTYWQILEIILGFKNKVVDNLDKKFYSKAPRIDYKIKNTNKLYKREFDYLKLIKSSISFKLAGLDEEMISYGLFESLAYFISNECDELNNKYILDGISLCGDIFRYNAFDFYINKSITKNFKKYYNKEFVVQK